MPKFLFWLALAISSQSYAARILPNQGQLGDLQAAALPEIKIDGKLYRTAPGLRIYGTNNALIMQNQTPQQAAVWYQFEATSGNIWRIWLLTNDEVATIKARPKTIISE
ncbi:hypothetical protein [Iodobacter fluviatilis]|uniref:Uncharacterized protein n=1 Tax=Iodobacter fluviatilis TaxID=537 RepID=A0A377SXU2_9NEIS|nr:hypothetical protein [Iodobacter fluviatilis]TCU82231.1 hypothetical protein EV682_11665 [Iodobacter fluviatilis]STR45126.1 Uncharacterised protein [Iodobacter fluviatilis]